MNRDSHKATALDRVFPPKATSWLRSRPVGAPSLLLLTLLLLQPAAVQAQFTFTTNNGAITITGYTGTGGAVTIPSATNGLPVISIGSGAFLRFSSITSITIPNSVTNIGSSAFYSCSGLTNVTISENVIMIGEYAFGFCRSLPNVFIPKSVASIGRLAFSTCPSLTGITVDALNSYYCSVDGVLFNKNQTTLIRCPERKVGSYVVSSSVTGIGNAAFAGCTNLIDVTIPNSVTSIGDAAFGNAGLTSVTVPDSVKSIGYQAFSDCASLTAVIIGNGVTNIGGYAFFRCHNLANVKMGNSVISIGDTAFWQCYALTSIVFPNTLTSIAGQAFVSCVNLTGLYFQGDAPVTDPSNSAFYYDYNAVMYYLPGAAGWGSTFGGRPTALWRPQAQTSDASFGVGTNQFGFNISWASGMIVVVEAATNLTHPIWFPVSTNTLTSGSSYFSDPQWTNHPTRFYRLRSP